MNHYQTLGVAADAEDIVIQAAFRVLAQKYHPDKQPALEQPAAQARMASINEAFRVLRDPVQRVRYDAALGNASATPTSRTARPTAWQRSSLALASIALTLATALALGIERKSGWRWAWEFAVSGFDTPSHYIVHWPILGLILATGLTITMRFARRTG